MSEDQEIADAIGTTEKESAKGVAQGQGHRLHGTLEQVAGKIEEGVGRVLNNPNQEAKGLAKQAEGSIEKAAGSIEEDASKQVFHGAVKADAEYVKP